MYSKAKKTAQWAVTKMRSLSARTAAPIESAPHPTGAAAPKTTADPAKAAKPAMAYQQGFTSGPTT
jgi:hypothetical protein